MKLFSRNSNSQRGEVAWLLTVVSMAVIGLGLVIGLNVNTGEQAALRTNPFAQTTTPTPTPRGMQPTNHHNICYIQKDGAAVAPDANAGLWDELCEMNFLPPKITLLTNKNFLKITKTSNTSLKESDKIENPVVLKGTKPLTTPFKKDAEGKDPNEPIALLGALCVKDSVNFDPALIDQLTFHASAVQADPGLPGVTGTPTSVSTKVKEYDIKSNGRQDGGSASEADFTGFANDKMDPKDYCKFPSPISNLRNRTNPIVMKISMRTKSILEQVKRAKEAGLFNAAECSMFIHADTNPGAAIDVYNITKVDLRKIFDPAVLAEYCSPQVTVTPPNTPTPTPTPLACTDTCTSSLQCGTYTDPATGAQARLSCQRVKNQGYVSCDPDSSPTSEGGDVSRGCTCMPAKCQGDITKCTPNAAVCKADEVTKVPSTPTPTVTVTPPPVTNVQQQCTYNALAFVEECNNPVDGRCLNSSIESRYDAKPIYQPILNLNTKHATPGRVFWGATNDMQDKNSLRTANDKPAEQLNFITGSAFDQITSKYADIFNFQTNTNQPSSELNGISAIAVTSNPSVNANMTKTELLEPNTNIKIANTTELPTNPDGTPKAINVAEQYTNMQEATVKLTYDTSKYRVIPHTNKIYSCVNDIAASFTAGSPEAQQYGHLAKGTGACFPSKNNSEIDPLVQNDEIKGLVVGCGQRIVYGWTLQKCNYNFDYVFVVDTSETMALKDPNSGDQLKIDVAEQNISSFIQKIKDSGSDSRVAVVTFNTGADYYSKNGSTFTFNGEAQKGIRSNFVDIKDIDSKILPITNNLNQYVKEGTCMECGLSDAQHLIKNRTEADKRTPVVIFLSDGLANSLPRTDEPVPFDYPFIYQVADNLRNDGAKYQPGVRNDRHRDDIKTAGDDTLLVTIGYGDSKLHEKEGQLYEVMRNIASDVVGKTSTDERWAYSTDKSVSGGVFDIADVFQSVKEDMNSCSRVQHLAEVQLKAKDINGDGIISILDMSAVFDNYYAKGKSLKEDINGDGVVNITDAMLVIENLGTVVTPAQSTPAQATPEVGDVKQ